MFSEENEIKFGKEVKIEIVQYGVDHRSWKEAASKYCVSITQIYLVFYMWLSIYI